MRVPAPFGFAVLVALAAFSWWLTRQADTSAKAGSATDARETGYFMQDASLDQTDATGRVNLRVHAADATQARADGDIELSTLRVDYVAGPRRDWIMTAAHGTLPPSGRTILLNGDVRLSGGDRSNLIVLTDHLLFNLDTELATTNEAVRISMPPHTVSAHGLRADLKHEALRLESAVDGTFTR